MPIVDPIGERYRSLVPVAPRAALVSAEQEDRDPSRIECKQKPKVFEWREPTIESTVGRPVVGPLRSIILTVPITRSWVSVGSPLNQRPNSSVYSTSHRTVHNTILLEVKHSATTVAPV